MKDDARPCEGGRGWTMPLRLCRDRKLDDISRLATRMCGFQVLSSEAEGREDEFAGLSSRRRRISEVARAVGRTGRVLSVHCENDAMLKLGARR